MNDTSSISHIDDHRRSAEPSRYAAVVVANLLDRWIETKSVLDLGCGTGTWLRGFAGGGRREVFGVEQEQFDPRDLAVEPDLIAHADLSQTLNLHRRFDLVLCLEVAEHIAAEAANTVVGNCVRHADVVLFSAALPGQQGRHHVNEQLPEYWVERFAAHGYAMFDVIRPRIWNDRNIPIWYRQNMLLFVRDTLPVVTKLRTETEREAATVPLNRAHPDLLRWFSNEATLARQSGAEAAQANEQLQRKLAETTTQLSAATTQLTATTTQLTAARSELKRVSYTVGLLKQEREVIVNSTIWRMTGPLRRAGRALPPPVRRMLRWSVHAVVAVPRKLHRSRVARGSVAAAQAQSGTTTGSWRIAVISGEPHNPGHYYRVVRFAEAAAAIGGTVLSITPDQVADHYDALAAADFVMIWRAAKSPEITAAIAAVRAGHGKLLVDIDDLMFVPELASDSVIDAIRSQGLDPAEVADHFLRVRLVMAQADACICTTNELAAHARLLEKATFVLPNGFAADTHVASRLAVRRRRAEQDDGLIRIGYALGTRTHQRDFGPAAEAIGTILHRHSRCRLVLFRDATTGQPMLDLREFPGLRRQSDQIEWRDLVPLAALPDELARFDINIAPLETGNPFCEAKSELKYFEAALAGVCTVASPTDPMRQAIRNGETGILADTPDAWHEALRALVEDADLRKRLAHAAYLDVICRYGPHRRAEQVLSLLSQLAGGEQAARAFELEFRRRNAPATVPLEIVPCDVVFSADALGTAPVSVIIPLYNYAGYVTEALESVRTQTIGSLDLIVVDDCSTDESLDVACTWAKRQAGSLRFNRIVVMRNRVNCGLARTRNVGFDAAETEFVVPLDADNRLLPDFCERTLAALRGSRAAFAYTKIQCFGDQDHVIGTGTFSQMQFAQANYIDAMALIAKWAWAEVGGYTHIQHGWEDYDFWCCCVERGIWGIHVPEILAEYRFHNASMLRTTTDVRHYKQEVVRQLEARHGWLSIADRG
jgi:glycosyltransferase involved in cell wall biosynthesis/SAM-dependent methyltransferase